MRMLAATLVLLTLARAATADEPKPEPDPDPGAGRKRIALFVGGGGVAMVALGAAFGASAHGAWGRVKSECGDPGACPTGALHTARNDSDDAHTAARRADWLIGLGGVALAGSVVLYLTAPRRGVHVVPADRGVGLALAGTL